MKRPHARTVLLLICCAGLLAGGVGVSVATSKGQKDARSASVGNVRQADCADWNKGSEDQRETMVAYLHNFGGGPVGSSAGIQRGPVLDDDTAYGILDSYCSKPFARAFRLYKLYARAAAFVGH